eukprot:scpid105985/ scgid35441/ 
MRLALTLTAILVAVCVLEAARAHPGPKSPGGGPGRGPGRDPKPTRRPGFGPLRRVKRAKKYFGKLCQSENDCRRRHCCVRDVNVAKDGSVAFSKKGECVPVRLLTNRRRFRLKVLDLGARFKPDFALERAVSRPPGADLLFICRAFSLEEFRWRPRPPPKKRGLKYGRRGVSAYSLLPDVLG